MNKESEKSKRTGNKVVAIAAGHNGIIYVVGSTGKVYMMNVSSPKKEWQQLPELPW